PPLQYVGAEAFRKPWQEVFERYQSPIHYEVRDLSVIAGDDVAFSHSLNRISGTMKNGRKTDLWLRWTACYHETNGKWRIVYRQTGREDGINNVDALYEARPASGAPQPLPQRWPSRPWWVERTMGTEPELAENMNAAFKTVCRSLGVTKPGRYASELIATKI